MADFYPYTDQNRDQFNLATQKQLNLLLKRFGRVEIREIEKTKEWCVRIVAGAEGERLPLAALGPSVYEAAERLTRISQFRDEVEF